MHYYYCVHEDKNNEQTFSRLTHPSKGEITRATEHISLLGEGVCVTIGRENGDVDIISGQIGAAWGSFMDRLLASLLMVKEAAA